MVLKGEDYEKPEGCLSMPLSKSVRGLQGRQSRLGTSWKMFYDLGLLVSIISHRDNCSKRVPFEPFNALRRERPPWRYSHSDVTGIIEKGFRRSKFKPKRRMGQRGVRTVSNMQGRLMCWSASRSRWRF